jgi:hypothetical protein
MKVAKAAKTINGYPSLATGIWATFMTLKYSLGGNYLSLCQT